MDQSRSPTREITPLIELKRRHGELGLAASDLAHALDVDPRTVDRWLSGQSFPQHTARRRLATLLDLYRHVLETFDTPDAAREWFQTPHRYLGWLTPADVVRAGRCDRVEGALEVLDSGIAI